ncbi:hypothetical protein [Hymenobacter sp. BRD67]|uniref:hypothetical protein n=1 Tax=Hymenobacter sp. BRD67 TaxID=2675877 RepID=UPI001563082D|nr:hypothetical protein [Hymenobacter sp. BRD67]QKG51961.1 hypothetical protein GKZ67_04225 [Hymenobacter sp. BRD67]
MAAAGTLAAVSSQYGGVAVLDVSNPAAPAVVGSTGCPAYNGGYDGPVAMTTTTLCLLSIPTNQLLTYSLSAAGVPTLRHTYTTGTTPVSVALSGSLAYVACRGSNALQVIDVSGASAVRGTVALDASDNNLALGPNLLLAANGSPANDLQAFVLNGPRSVTVAPDGTIGTTALPTPGDYVQNQPATTQSGGFNLNNSGYLGTRLGIGTTAPVTRLDVRNVSSNFPATSGSVQSTGHFARFADGSGMVLDLGGNGGNGAWFQSTNSGGLGTSYPLLLNPNGGSIGINTTAPARSLDIGSLNSPRPALLRLGAGNGGVARQWELGVQVNTGNLNDVTGEYYDFVVRDATGGNTRLLVEYNTGNVGIGTSSPSQPLDVKGNANVGGALSVGVAASPGQVLTPTTTHNMLAVAYGQVGIGPVIVSTSGNYTVSGTGSGVYTITFPASSGLSNVNFDGNPVTVSVYGATPGLATFTGGQALSPSARLPSPARRPTFRSPSLLSRPEVPGHRSGRLGHAMRLGSILGRNG